MNATGTGSVMEIAQIDSALSAGIAVKYEADSNLTLIVIIAGIGGLIVLCCCGGCIYLYVYYRQQVSDIKHAEDARMWREWEAHGKVPGVLTFNKIDPKSLQEEFRDGPHGRLWRVKLKGYDQQLLLHHVPVEVIEKSAPAKLAEHCALLHRLHHEHLVHFIGLVRPHTGIGSWGELVVYEGRHSLANLLYRAESHEETATALKAVWVHMLSSITSGISYLHSHEIAHLSLHPGNVLLDKDMRVKLSDFGRRPEALDRVASKMIDEEPLTGGEPRWLYLPPEVLKRAVGDDGFASAPPTKGGHMIYGGNYSKGGKKSPKGGDDGLPPLVDGIGPWTRHVDLWALGCMIARIASIKPLYARALNDPLTLWGKIQNGEFGPAHNLTLESREVLSSLPDGLVECIELCASFRPALRLEARDLLTTLIGLKHQMAEARKSLPSSTTLPSPAKDTGTYGVSTKAQRAERASQMANELRRVSSTATMHAMHGAAEMRAERLRQAEEETSPRNFEADSSAGARLSIHPMGIQAGSSSQVGRGSSAKQPAAEQKTARRSAASSTRRGSCIKHLYGPSPDASTLVAAQSVVLRVDDAPEDYDDDEEPVYMPCAPGAVVSSSAPPSKRVYKATAAEEVEDDDEEAVYMACAHQRPSGGSDGSDHSGGSTGRMTAETMDTAPSTRGPATPTATSASLDEREQMIASRSARMNAGVRASTVSRAMVGNEEAKERLGSAIGHWEAAHPPLPPAPDPKPVMKSSTRSRVREQVARRTSLALEGEGGQASDAVVDAQLAALLADESSTAPSAPKDSNLIELGAPGTSLGSGVFADDDLFDEGKFGGPPPQPSASPRRAPKVAEAHGGLTARALAPRGAPASATLDRPPVGPGKAKATRPSGVPSHARGGTAARASGHRSTRKGAGAPTSPRHLAETSILDSDRLRI